MPGVMSIISHRQARQRPADRSAGQTPQLLYAQATRGLPTLNDALDSRLQSYWRPSSAVGGACTFVAGAFQVSATRPNYAYSCYAWPAFSSFAFQVRLTIVSGDQGGIAFRAGARGLYLFSISVHQTYRLTLYPAASSGSGQVLTGGNTPAIANGASGANGQPQSNLLTVIARGSQIYLYINQRFVSSVVDTTLTIGTIGLCAIDDGHPTSVLYSQVRAWTLPST
jgi:hypothetical protein